MATTENQALMVLQEEGAAAPTAPPTSATPPAFFVILKPGQGSEGGRDQGILVANQEANMATNSTPGLPPTAPCVPSVKLAAKSSTQPENLPPESTCKSIKVTLDNNNMWNEFYRCKTEMILTKQGRRMFPYCRFRISGMEPFQRYILVMDITPVDNHRYRWTGQQWEVNGRAEPHVLGRVFIHPDSPSSGHYWMQNPVSFYKLKLTNNTLDQEGHVILHSKHRYLPRLHVVPADKATEVIQLNGPDVMTFTFPQTEFIAVTAYQNLRITQLKIDYNPFAKGFREDAPGHQPFRPRLELPNASTEPPRFMSDSEDVAPLKKSLKSLLLNSEDVFVMDQELFSATDYNIGFLDNGISSAKSFEKDHNSKKQPQPAALVEVLPETKQRAWRSVPEGSHQAGGSDQTHVDSILKEEEVELAVDRAVSQEPWPDTQVDAAKVRMPAKPGIAIKPPSDPTPVASPLEPQQASPGSWPVLSESPRGNGHDSSRSRPLAPPAEMPLQKPVRLGKKPEPVPLPLLALFLKQRRLKPRPIAPKPSPSAPESPSPVPEPLSPVPVSLSPPPAVAPLSPAPALQLSAPASSSPIPMLPSPFYDRPENSGCLEGTGHQVPAPCGSTTSSTAPPVALSSAKRKRKPKPRFRKHSRRAGRLEAEQDVVIGGPTDVNMQPNLEDVEGLLFVSFTSKEALEFHLGDQPLNREVSPPPPQKMPEPSKDDVPETEEEKIARLEIALLQDLKRIRHRQVIHPVLQEVGLKLNLLDPTLAIDLRYLGVCLPLPPPFLCTGDEGTSGGWMSSPDGAVAFISRTGKTTDFTKIKGWRDKFNINPDVSSAKQEGNTSLDGVLKNRSAFCSDMLDAYLANEGKLIDERAASFTQSTISPVVYQLPTKSTSYVRTLDSVLKKQTLSPTFPSSPFKPLSPLKKHTVPPCPKASARPKLTPSKLKPTPAHVAVTLASPVLTNCLSPASHNGKPAAKTKVVPKALKAPASGPAAAPEDLPDKLHMKQDQAGSGRGVGLSKMLVKLMDLEDGALWEGRARTCITEERAEIALASLLTAQGASKASPSVTRIMKRRAPPCFNDFCRLGCVCTSLALECRQQTHCGKTECMFGCTCLKRKVVLLKAPPKKKKQEQEDLIFYGALGEDAPSKKKKKRRRMMAYTISQPEPHSEPATRVRTLWNGKDEADPEPLYIPEPVLFPSSAAPVVRQDSSGFNQHPPRTKVEQEDDRKDPVYLYFESKMTCARVRAYKSKNPPRQTLCPCKSVLCSGREDDPCHNFFEAALGKQGVLSMQSTLKTQPSKRLEIVSECKWGRRSDRNHVLRVVCEHMAQNRLSNPFRVGPYHIRPLSQTARNEDQGQSVTYKVCISQAPLAEGEVVEKAEAGNWSVNEDQPKVYKVGGVEPPRRTVLPFLTGVSPAGILTACKKQRGVPAQGLIKVNGRSYPQAKLQLGQMGALHPANRLAAYITGRLQPIGQEVSAASTISKQPSLDATTVTVSTMQPPHWTAVPMTTSITTVTSVSSGSAIVVKPLEGNTAPKTTVSPSAGSMGPGPRMLLIPVSPSASGVRGPAPAARPSTPGVHLAAPPFPPLAPGQRMVLQPVRSSSGTTLYRHPNGHLIQLVPLSQLRAVQPSMVIRSPASVIRFPTPSASASSSAPSLKSPVSSTAIVTGSTASAEVTSTAAMAGRNASPSGTTTLVPMGSPVISPTQTHIKPASGISTAATLVTSHASAPKLTSLTLNSLSPSLKTLPGFLGQTGTYTVRISPSTGSKETKLISLHPTGSPQGSAEVLSVPGTFTLLQLPKSHVALQPVPPTAVAGTSAPGKGDSAAASSTRAGETPHEFQGLEVSQEVTPAGLVCADHSYTSGRSPPEGLQDGAIGSAPLQERPTVSPNQVSLQKITPTTTAHASTTLSSSSKPPPKTPPRGAEVATPSMHMVSEEQCNSGLLSGATEAKDTTQSGPPCGMSEKRHPLEEGEVEAEVEVDLDVDGVSEDMTEDSEEESEDNSEDDAISVVSESEDSEEGEAVDIETVEELTEKINIARMKAAAMQRKLNKVRSVQDAKRAELKVRKEQEDEEGVSEVVVRMQHNVMERRRRNELRHLFDKLRQALGLQNMPKVSKVYILNQAISEIQAMVDQCDRLEEKKRMLSRQQAAYIRKISQTSGKNEDLIIRKLQDICAKQKSLEAQRKRKTSKQAMPQPPREPATPDGRLAAPCSLGRRPNILSRRKPPAPAATALPETQLSLVSSGTLISGLAVGVANQQVLTIKGALQPVSTFLQPSKTPEMGGRLSAIPGVASVTINVPGISFPVRVKSPAAEVSPAGPGQVISSTVKTSPTARKTCTLPKIVSVKSLVPFPQKVEKEVAQPPASMQNSGIHNTEDHGSASLEDGEVLEEQVTCGGQEEPGQGSAGSLEEETLMSLLSEIAFLNQQTNSEDSRPQGAIRGHCSPQEARNRPRETGEEETAAPKWAGRVGDLEGDDERSLSPLFLQLDEDLQRSKDTCPEEVKVQAEGEQCVKIVLEQGKQLQQGPDPPSAAVANGFGQQSPTSSIKGGALTPPPLLQMKVGSAAMAMDSKAKRGEKGCEVSWRPMPRLAPLGLKTSVLAQDSAMSSAKAPPDAQMKDSMQAAS